MILLRHRWQQKPPVGSAEIDWSHPLARELAFLVLMNEAGGFARTLTPVGINGVLTNNASWMVGHRGVAIDCPSGGTAYVAYPLATDNPFLRSSGMSLTWGGLVRTGSAYRHFASKHLTNGAANNPFEFRTNNAATPLLQCTRAKVSNFSTATGPAITLNRHQFYSVTYPDNTFNSTPAFWIDGVQSGSMSPAASDPATGAGADIQLGRRPDGAVQLDGYMSYFAIHSLPSDIRWLHAEPYAFLRPRVRRWISLPPATPAAAPTGWGRLLAGDRNRLVVT